jgi:hypothetical protein
VRYFLAMAYPHAKVRPMRPTLNLRNFVYHGIKHDPLVLNWVRT